MQKLFWGVLSSLLGNCLIGLSFTLKRWIGSNARGASMCARLANWKWWISLLALLVGEVLNFAAYVTAPSFLVVLLGCVNVLSTQVSSALVLREYFTSVRLLGTISIALGVTLCIVSTPVNETPAIRTLPEVWQRLGEPTPQILLSLAVTTLLVLFVIAFQLERYRVRANQINNEPVQNSITVVGLGMYATGAVCAVTITKCVGIIANNAIFLHRFYFTYAPFYGVWPVALVFWATQIWLINWLLSHLEASAITPLMYLSYSLSGVFASGTFYKEFSTYGAAQAFLLSMAAALMCFGCYCVTRQYPRDIGFFRGVALTTSCRKRKPLMACTLKANASDTFGVYYHYHCLSTATLSY